MRRIFRMVFSFLRPGNRPAPLAVPGGIRFSASTLAEGVLSRIEPARS